MVNLIENLFSSEAVAASVLGATIALVGRWLIDIVRRNQDEHLNVYVKELWRLGGAEEEPHYRITLLFENAAPVPIIVRAIAINKPEGVAPMTFVSIAHEYFRKDRVSLNVPVPPFSVGEEEIMLSVSKASRNKLYLETFEGRASYTKRGKEKHEDFTLPYHDISSRTDQDEPDFVDGPQ